MCYILLLQSVNYMVVILIGPIITEFKGTWGPDVCGSFCFIHPHPR